jgi:hypothetical protein
LVAAPKSFEQLLLATRTIIAEQAGINVEKISAASQLEEDLRISGDDLVELVDVLFEKLSIAPGDFSHLRHGAADGFSLFGGVKDRLLARAAPERIPLRVSMFVYAAMTGRWNSAELLGTAHERS